MECFKKLFYYLIITSLSLLANLMKMSLKITNIFSNTKVTSYTAQTRLIRLNVTVLNICIYSTGAANVSTGQTRSLWQAVKTYMGTKSYNPLFMITSNRGAFGYHMGHLIDNPELIREAAVELLELYNQGKIKPTIDSVWSFEDVSLLLTVCIFNMAKLSTVFKRVIIFILFVLLAMTLI